ncbi:alpha,alpha-trehalase nth1 [Coemansia sp. Benny D115]|nr:alpha,alpha-trehalase nth1 [Coemansia sp. Benny D115]
MHILSSIKQHVASVAGTSLAPNASRKQSHTDTSNEHQQHQQNSHYHQPFSSIRKAIGSSTGISRSRSRSKSKSGSRPSDVAQSRASRPCPPITIQTKDISWPMGSGDRESARLEDYDFVNARDLRPLSAAASDSYDLSHDQRDAMSPTAAAALGNNLSKGGTFPLSQQRAMALSRGKERPLLIRTNRARTADSLDGATANSVYAAYPPRSTGAGIGIGIGISSSSADVVSAVSGDLTAYTSAPASASASASMAAFDAGSSVPVHRSYSEDAASPMPLSPATPTSAFSFVSIHSPISLKAPAKTPLSSPAHHRLRRAGTVSGLRSSMVSSTTNFASTSTSNAHAGYLHTSSARLNSPDQRNKHLHSSYNSLVLSSHTPASTVVSSSSSLASSTNRPISLDSVVVGGSSGASGTSGTKRPPKKPLTDDDELRGSPPRDDWDIVFDRIKEYRATHEAPVDTVGCEALTAEEKDPKRQRFRSLISLMLSAQTKDEITAEAVRNLSQRLPGGLTPKSLSEASMELIHECVRRVGFWQRKSNYIKEAARTCLEQHDGDIPRTVPQLLSLPGVGPKMAYLAMQAAWHDSQGIGVDTHVLRISHRLGWVSELSKTPEATRHSLESWLPKSLWREINPLLVGLGQTVCRAVGPKCGECPVSQYCPSANLRPKTSSSSKTRKSLEPPSQETVFGESTELGGVDVEDLASIVRGAEHAVRSRKSSGGRTRQGIIVKAEFPEIPDSPMAIGKRADAADGTASDGGTRARARSRAYSRRYQMAPNLPFLQGNAESASHTQAGYTDTESGSITDGGGVKSSRNRSRSKAGETKTPATSHYFMRSRSNAASEEVRPEAKTDAVRNARAKVSAKKLYSRRLSVSDMQWALGEDWDPDGSSSLSESELADVKPPIKKLDVDAEND